MKIEATPRNRAGELALEIYRRTLEQIRGDRLVEAQVWLEGDMLFVDDIALNLPDYERIFVCGAGKASPAMAQGLLNVLGDRIHGGLVVTKHDHAIALGKIEVLEAGHPVPDEASFAAGAAMLDFAAQTTSRDLVLFVLSGGASALMESPVEGISFEDVQAVNRQLLAGGLWIGMINLIRSQLSKIKSGGLARAFAAEVVCVVMSDVAGNSLNTIGSGPFVPLVDPIGLDLLPEFAGFDQVLPDSVVRLLRQPPPRTMEDRKVEHRIVGDTEAMASIAGGAARELGLKPTQTGVQTLGGLTEHVLGSWQRSEFLPGYFFLKKIPDCFIAVGEPTVVVKGSGLGGRAQEMAMVAAKSIEDHPGVSCLCAGTDGTDGPTDAAGALVDSETISRARAKGFGYDGTLANNDSYHFHEAAGTLIKTGPTGSNLNDLLIFIKI